MAQIDGAGQQDTDNQNAETLQAALAQRQVTLQGQPQGGSDVPIHQNSDPVSDESEILRSCQPLTGKRRVPWYRPSASSRLWPARPAALCLPDPCGLGSDSHGDNAFSGKLLELLTQTGSQQG